MKALIFFILMAVVSVLALSHQFDRAPNQTIQSDNDSSSTKALRRSWKNNWMGP